MDYEMEGPSKPRNSTADVLNDLDWQIDSEWVKLPPSSASLLSVNSKKKNRGSDFPSMTNIRPRFHFTPSGKGERLLIVEKQALRLSKKTNSGFSYWICNIPNCSARCFLDPSEKEIVRYAGDHNHDADVSRPEFKSFIHALKIAVKENPHVKPRDLYDNELERVTKMWKDGGTKKTGNELSLPSFDDVRTAMYNTRNAVLSLFSLRATEEMDGDVGTKPPGPTRSTRSKDGKVNGKRKSSSSKSAAALSSADIEELVIDETMNDKAAVSQSPYQILDESNFCLLPSAHESQLLVVNDYLLQRVKIQQPDFSYWICRQKRCNFIAIYDIKFKSKIKTKGLHNHLSDPGSLKKWKFINVVKQKLKEYPQSSSKQIYDAEIDTIRRQVGEENNTLVKFPSYAFVKRHLFGDETISFEDNDDEVGEDEMSLPSTIEEVARREVTEEEKEFLEDVSEQPQEISGMNLSILTPKPIKSRNFPDLAFYFVPSKKGKRILVVNDFTFHLNSQKSGGRCYWKCTVELCLYRCVYNQDVKDIVKVTGKHTHMTNIHQLRSREFIHLLKTKILEDPSLTPKVVYDRELEKLKKTDNGASLMAHMPAYASVRTSLYNIRNKKNYEPTETDLSNNCSSTIVESDREQDISPKAITHLSLEDNENMEYDNGDKETSPNQSMEIAAPSLYDSHDIMDQFSDGSGREKASSDEFSKSHVEFQPEDQQIVSSPDPSSFAVTFVPTNRGGQALAVNDCVLRSSFVRDSVTYWRCQQKKCPFKCSYDSKTEKLLRVSGKHNHSINPWNLHVRSFVRKLKKRMCQDSHLPSNIIYEQEISHLRKEGKTDEFLSKLPSYESLKSALYKFKRCPSSDQDDHECLQDSSVEKCGDIKNLNRGDYECQRYSSEEPPEDCLIENLYTPLNANLASWLGQHPERKVVDGHLLIRKSDTGWVCPRKGCLFRCVIDNESKTVLRGKWYHTHRSEVRRTICQTIFNAAKRRAQTDPKLNTRIIYSQEKRRIENKIAKNPALLKFIPSFAQVHQLILRNKAKQYETSKQESLSTPISPKLSVMTKGLSKSQTTTCSNHSPVNRDDNVISDCNANIPRLSLTPKDDQDLFPHQQRNTNHHQNRNNPFNIESMPCTVDLDTSFNYDNHSLNQLAADFDYSVVDPSMSQEPLTSQQALNHESIVNHINQNQMLNLNEIVAPEQSDFLNDESSVTHFNLKRDHLTRNTRFHSENHNHTNDYNQNSSRSSNMTSQFLQPSQNTRVLSSDPHSSRQIVSNSNHSSQQILSNQSHSHDQPPLPIIFESDLNRETNSLLSASFSAPVSLSSSSFVSSLSSQQPTTHPYIFPQQSLDDKNVFTLHGYPIFPASVHPSGHIYWQCRISGCHFQCVCNAGTGQIVQISGNHNHEPPSSQQSLSSQVTKMLLRKAVEDLDRPVYNIYWDYMQSLHNLLDSNSIFNALPRYDDVQSAMENARAAMGIGSVTNPRLMLSQHQNTGMSQDYGTSTHTVQIHSGANYADFALDSVSNRLILHGEEMTFLWRKDEILHWKCKNSGCGFKCMYDEEVQSLHVLNSHSSHCQSKSKEIYHNSAIKRRYPEQSSNRTVKYPRLDH